ncbi:type VII secretion protein [Streptomyces javensis]|uniref:MinD-like ATPase involved in chromosome partitioning or flagellar assembly n=1 Tax=Streptomyces javensis TaxID=114698 RepID=A0ABN1XGY5_9ACTN
MGAGDWQSDVLHQLRNTPASKSPGPSRAAEAADVGKSGHEAPEAAGGPHGPKARDAADVWEAAKADAPKASEGGSDSKGSEGYKALRALMASSAPGAGEAPGGSGATEADPAPAPRRVNGAAGPDDPEPASSPAPADRRPEARPQHLPAPTPVPPVDPRLALAQGRLRSGDPVTRRAGRTLRRLVAASASREVEEATEVARSVQQPVTTGRQIAVSSMRGGAGKTTVAALLNLTFAHYRQDPVLVVEADPALGSLPIRLGAESVRWTCADVARIVTPSMQFAEVTGYLVQLPEGGWLLPGSQGRIGTPLDIRAYRTVTMALRRYFGVTVVDCETLPGELARTALDTVQARVLVAPATLEGVASTRTVLDWMAAVPRPMLPGTVVALTQSSPDTALDLDAARAHLAESGVEVMAIPYDRHLAAGGAIRTGLLAHSTRLAAGRLAAALLDRAVRDRGGRR